MIKFEVILLISIYFAFSSTVVCMNECVHLSWNCLSFDTDANANIDGVFLISAVDAIVLFLKEGGLMAIEQKGRYIHVLFDIAKALLNAAKIGHKVALYVYTCTCDTNSKILFVLSGFIT